MSEKPIFADNHGNDKSPSYRGLRLFECEITGTPDKMDEPIVDCMYIVSRSEQDAASQAKRVGSRYLNNVSASAVEVEVDGYMIVLVPIDRERT